VPQRAHKTCQAETRRSHRVQRRPADEARSEGCPRTRADTSSVLPRGPEERQLRHGASSYPRPAQATHRPINPVTYGGMKRSDLGDPRWPSPQAATSVGTIDPPVGVRADELVLGPSPSGHRRSGAGAPFYRDRCRRTHAYMRTREEAGVSINATRLGEQVLADAFSRSSCLTQPLPTAMDSVSRPRQTWRRST